MQLISVMLMRRDTASLLISGFYILIQIIYAPILLKNFVGYIKMKEKSAKIAYSTSLDLLPTRLFLFMVPFATTLLLFLF